MTRIIIGFMIGIAVASANADGLVGSIYPDAIMMTARTPTGHSMFVQVDMDGYVICSPERKP